MALLNLALTTLNADGSTTVFGEQGNAIEDIESGCVTTVFAESSVPLVQTAVPIWYAPADTSVYFQNLLDNPQFFSTIGDVKVFKMYLGMVSWPDATLQAFFAFLSANNVKLGVEAPALIAAPGQPGSGIEGFVPAGALLAAVTRIKTLGGDLSYISWDEPAYFGSVSTGFNTITEVATQVALSSSEVQAIFPNVQIGDTEPVTALENSATLQAWFTAYAQASGTQFSSFTADTDTGEVGWQANLASTITMAHANNIAVGEVIIGLGAAANNDAWSATAVANALQMLSDPALRPDYLDVQSWQIYPSASEDATVPGDLASVAADIAAGESAALAVPAVAHYAASGILQSVTWSGGWTASENGTSLVFTSPTGTVVSQFAWSNVRVFAFEPDTGTVSLTVSGPSTRGEHRNQSAAPLERDTTYAVNVAAGSFVFAAGTPTTAVSSGALTLTLASTTGFAGSGVTNQVTPTLTGTAAPNSAIQLRVDGTSVGTLLASATGAWTYTIATRIAAGAHLIEATVAATSRAASQDTMYVVSVDPTQRLSSTLGLAPGSDTGYAGDGITDDKQPVFAGVDDPDVLLGVAIDGRQVGTAVSDVNGNWTYTPSLALAVGSHTVRVIAAGPPGTSAAPATMSLTIDTAAHEAAMISPDPLFDPAWYLLQHPGIALSAAAAYTQYMTQGWKEGFDPSPFFSTSYYLQQYPDVAAAGVNPLQHFEDHGWAEDRNPSSTFNTAAYMAANPGLPAGEDPLVAYINSLTVSAPPTTASAASDAAGISGAALITGKHAVVGTGNDMVVAAGTALAGDTSGTAIPDVRLATVDADGAASPANSVGDGDGDRIGPGASPGVTSGETNASAVNGGVLVSRPGGGSELEITTGGTVTLNAATIGSAGGRLTVILDAATNLTLSRMQFIDAVGSNGSDTITAGATHQTLTGRGGIDTLVGYAGGYDKFQDTAAGLFGDTIKNFRSTDQIDIRDLIPGGAMLTATQKQANTAVMVVSGAREVSFLMSGSFAQAGFALTNDGVKGTIVTYTHNG